MTRIDRVAEGGHVVRRRIRRYRYPATGHLVEEVEEDVAPPDWRAAAWVLERRHPDGFARPSQLQARECRHAVMTACRYLAACAAGAPGEVRSHSASAFRKRVATLGSLAELLGGVMLGEWHVAGSAGALIAVLLFRRGVVLAPVLLGGVPVGVLAGGEGAP
ncbi:hypothetical protein [Actinomadura napierensis]|uniref:Uncharacterized protein n=1 Tax=Actinomadura napierensis TaxID=267854 RepID=A0ABP5M1R4_9ACTN